MSRLHFVSGNKKIFIRLAMHNHLYVSKKWTLYRWLDDFKKHVPADIDLNMIHITLVFNKTMPVGIAMTHVLFIVGENDDPVLDMNLYLKKEYRRKGIGSKMIEHHLNCLPAKHRKIPIMFNYGLKQNDSIINHLENKYSHRAYKFSKQ